MSYKGEVDKTSASYAMANERVFRKRECAGMDELHSAQEEMRTFGENRAVFRKREQHEKSKCVDCKNNARRGMDGVIPFCIVTGREEDAHVVSCPDHEAMEIPRG